MAERHVTDPLLENLFRIYWAASRNLETTVRAALERGIDPENIGQRGAASAAYRQGQLAQARRIIAAMQTAAGQAAPIAVQRSYRAGVIAVDKALGPRARAAGTFGRVHRDAVRVLATNMSGALDAAAATVGQNVETVFERMAMLDGPLTPKLIAELPVIGRRVDDPYRSAALQQIAESTVQGDTRRQVSAGLARRLQQEGLADALTGFVDAGGSRWPLEHYTRMVARTTTREAMTSSTTRRLLENGEDLITITEHEHPADECTPYEGRTWSLNGKTAGYPIIDALPPFHPNCVHVVAPSTSSLDSWEADLAAALEETA